MYALIFSKKKSIWKIIFSTCGCLGQGFREMMWGEMWEQNIEEPDCTVADAWGLLFHFDSNSKLDS